VAWSREKNHYAVALILLVLNGDKITGMTSFLNVETLSRTSTCRCG